MQKGNMPLHTAVRFKKKACVEALLKADEIDAPEGKVKHADVKTVCVFV